ncbi:MAG: tetratricopeptide repeat protein [Planctomycetales bacterium]
MKEFQALLDQFPQHKHANEALFYSAEALLQLSRYAEADKQFFRFLERAPEHELALNASFRQGESRYLDGQYEQSIGPLAKFIQQRGQHNLASLARIYLAGAHLAVAEIDNKEIEVKQDHLVTAEQLYQDSLESAAGKKSGELGDQCRFGLARCQHMLGKKQKALAGYQVLLNSPTANYAPQSHLYLAEIHSDAGRNSDAALTYSALINLAPESRWAHAAHGRLVLEYASEGDFESARTAMDMWQTMVGADGLDQQILSATAHVAQQAGQVDWSNSLYQLLVDTADDADGRSRGLRNLAAAQIESGELAEAVSTLTRLVGILQEDEEKSATNFLLAATLQKMNRTTEALESFRSIEQRWPNSQEAARALYQAALLLESQDKKQEAAEIYQRLVDRPVSENWTVSDKCAVLYRFAWTLQDLGQSAQSVKQFLQLHENHRESEYWSDATYRVALRAMESGEYQKVRTILAGILDRDKNSALRPHALYLDARAAQKITGWQGMQPPLRQLLSACEDKALRLTALYWLAESAYQLKQYNQAKPRFVDLMERRLELPEKYHAAVLLRSAQLRATRGKWQETRQLCDQIRKDYPGYEKNDEVHYLLGRCHLNSAEFDLARQEFRQASPVDKAATTETAAMAAWMIGESYMHQQEYEQALSAYFRVDALYPFPRWQAAALLQAAKSYQQLDRPQEAIKLFQQIQDKYPTTVFGKDAGEQLQAIKATPLKPTQSEPKRSQAAK